MCLNPLSSRPEEFERAGKGAVSGRIRRTTGRRLGLEAKRLEERGTQVVVQPVAEDLGVMGGNLMSTALAASWLKTAQRTMAEQLRRSDLTRLLAQQPRIATHRAQPAPGPVEQWPQDALPAGTPVEGAGAPSDHPNDSEAGKHRRTARR